MKILTIVLVFIACAAHASGFEVSTQNARATGMGNAYVAVADDPAGIFYNPGGIVGPTGLDLQVGDTLIVPSLRYQSPTGEVTDARTQALPPPHLYVRYGFHPRVAFGLGLFSPYGASVQWPEEWAGRYSATSTQLTTYEVVPTVAIQFHEKVKGGFGLRFVRGAVRLNRDLPFGDTAGSVSLDGSGWSYGFSGGVQLRVIKDYLEIGGSWRTGIDLPIDGTAHFTAIPGEYQSILHDQGFSTEMRLADVWMGGIKSRPIKGLLLAIDGHYTTWNGFRQMRLHFDNKAANTEITKIWFDTVSIHVGGEYEWSKELLLRAGLAWDPSPTRPSTLEGDLPDGDRYRAAIGAGYSFGALRVDGSYQFVHIVPTRSTAVRSPGTFSGMAHELALTLGYRLQ